MSAQTFYAHGNGSRGLRFLPDNGPATKEDIRLLKAQIERFGYRFTRNLVLLFIVFTLAYALVSKL